MDAGSHDVFDLDESEIDSLPYGLIAVDADGTILQYNSYESQLARLSKDRTIGRNFFRDVAPCAAVQEFQGRFERFVTSDRDGTESFDFIFRFSFGVQQVHITFARRIGDRSIKILVNRYDAS